MPMMALLPPGGVLGGYAGDPVGVNGSWEEACTCVSTSIRVRESQCEMRLTGAGISSVRTGLVHVD